MDCETSNQLLALIQVRGGAFQKSTMKPFAKIVSNANLMSLTLPTKHSMLNA